MCIRDRYNPAPQPPAAPPPLTFETSTLYLFLIIFDKFFKPFSKISISTRFLAPFCGEYKCDAPFLPKSLFSTSQASSNFIFLRSSLLVFSIFLSWFRYPPPFSNNFFLSSKNLKPNADKIPVPPSLVALPPKPIIILSQPLSMAFLISIPVP